jgi:hypothetical protein
VLVTGANAGPGLEFLNQYSLIASKAAAITPRIGGYTPALEVLAMASRS